MTSADSKKSFKPPVPARPKNLIVLNSKHLPKPPENISSDNITNFIKGLNLDVNKPGSIDVPFADEPDCKESLETYTTPTSDIEEDIDGYLEPVAMPGKTDPKSLDSSLLRKKSTQEDNTKLSDILKKVINRNSSCSSSDKEVPECEESKPSVPQSQRQRPLPLLPVEKDVSVTDMPWYKNVDRKQGEELLKNGVDGYFLIRPSSKGESCLTLTLWFHNRLYNIPIRKRRDGQYALGTPKTHEQSFNSIEEMVTNYQSEKLVLYSNGAKTGRTLLTSYPP